MMYLTYVFKYKIVTVFIENFFEYMLDKKVDEIFCKLS